jgi:hypothetical protein
MLHCANFQPGLDGQGACSVDIDCGPDSLVGTCRPKPRCFFGPPLPIPNGPLSVCVTNAVREDASGVLDAATGEATLTIPLESRVSLTGNQASPCPRCVGGVCAGGKRSGLACTAVGAQSTTADCPPAGLFSGAIAVTLRDVTTSTSVTTADANGNFCADQATPGFFGRLEARRAIQHGAPAGDLSAGEAGTVTLGGTFCIPATGNGIIDTVSSLPGPGSVSLHGTLQLE